MSSAKQAKSSKGTGKRTDHLKPWQFKPGVSGNPSGKAKGTLSLKSRVKNMLLNMNDKEAREFLRGLDKRLIWEMAEGKPQQALTGADGGPIQIQAVEVVFKDK